MRSITNSNGYYYQSVGYFHAEISPKMIIQFNLNNLKMIWRK